MTNAKKRIKNSAARTDPTVLLPFPLDGDDPLLLPLPLLPPPLRQMQLPFGSTMDVLPFAHVHEFETHGGHWPDGNAGTLTFRQVQVVFVVAMVLVTTTVR